MGVAYAIFYAHEEPPAPPGYAETQGPLDKGLLNVLFFYDAVHYLRIAQEGYSLEETPWFPLYPLLIRLSGGTAASAVTISNICFFTGLAAIYRLGRRRAVLLACVSPIGIVFSAAYAESLFFCLAAWFLLFLREKKWFSAGFVAGLGALSRPPGWALVGALCLSALHRRGRAELGAAALALGLAALYPFYQFIVFGNPFMNSVVSEAIFSRRLMFPLWGTLHDVTRLLSGAFDPGMATVVCLNLLGWLWLGAGMVVPDVAVPGALYVIFVLSFPITKPGYMHATHALLRYACVWPGAYLGLARACRTAAWVVSAVAGSAAVALFVSLLVAYKCFVF
ncbi:hypothetical protein [Thermanaeromonas toyohensis]|uniref:hypothetical protein n=1 Tax=Thermanaeromonas toyohensis TaxID=161154 RepID=UPI00156020D3|nr:hypothetical protein [Thermanaeromonas toyohensis]